MTTATEVHGICDARFSAVRDAFAQNFEKHGEVGASLALMVDGEMVVDIWGGSADAAGARPWERDTIVNVFSTTKGMTAICAHRLVDEGRLDLDAPVARYWPEFAQAGKEKLPVRYLLSHRAGLPALKDVLPLGAGYQWEVMTTALAAQEPWWEPGTKHGYHAVTYGFLVGEVIRRITGMSVGAYFRKTIAEPLGADFHIGLAPEHDARTADVVPAPLTSLAPEGPLAAAFTDPQSMTFKAFMITADAMVDPNYMNSANWRRAEIPSVNGHGNARALATMYGALARGGELNGYRVLSQEAIKNAISEQSSGDDAVILGIPSRFGLGFALERPEYQYSPNGRLFGHGGMGGSFGYADPEAKIGIGYAMNKMILPPDMVDPRWRPMFNAIYESL
jgi:CubicO group peptidase (beta-lactamase class C family)